MHGVIKNVDFVLAGSVMTSEERTIVAKVQIIILTYSHKLKNVAKEQTTT